MYKQRIKKLITLKNKKGWGESLLRTLITIIIIVILLLGGSLVSHQYLKASTQALGVPLESIERSITGHKWELAGEELNNAHLLWNKDKSWWTILLDHKDIDNIDISIRRLQNFVQAQDFSQSLGELSALKYQVNQIYETSKINLKNIF